MSFKSMKKFSFSSKVKKIKSRVLWSWDFPGGPVVKNPPWDAGDVGSIPGQGTKMPHAVEQPSLHTAATKACALWSRCATARESMGHRKRSCWCNEDPTVQFSRSVASSSLWLHGLQDSRPPCASPTPGVYSNSCPLSRWCHPAISSSVIPFSFAFNLSQHQGLFQWVSSSHQVAKILEFQLQHHLPMNVQDWFL